MKMNRVAILAAVSMAGLCVTTAAKANDGDWRRKVGQLIKANYSYPRSAQHRGEQGRAQIKIAISAAGKVLSVSLVESSGSAILDREAVRIPMKVGSFPPPPTGGKVELVYPINFKMDD